MSDFCFFSATVFVFDIIIRATGLKSVIKHLPIAPKDNTSLLGMLFFLRKWRFGGRGAWFCHTFYSAAQQKSRTGEDFQAARLSEPAGIASPTNVREGFRSGQLVAYG